MLLTHEGTPPTCCRPKETRVIRLDAEEDHIRPLRARSTSRSPQTHESLVYVTYTSGSTGKPKGIAMTQRPL